MPKNVIEGERKRLEQMKDKFLTIIEEKEKKKKKEKKRKDNVAPTNTSEKAEAPEQTVTTTDISSSAPTDSLNDPDEQLPAAKKQPKTRTNTKKVMEEIKANSWYTYYGEQVIRLVSDGTWASKDVLVSQRLQ